LINQSIDDCRLEREFHQTALEARQRMRERIKQMDRAALLQHNQQSRLVSRRSAGKAGGTEDEVGSMANDITASLHRMTRTMQEENDKAILSHQILERSTRKLQSTNVKYDEFGGVLGETSGAIKGLWRRERSDKFWIGLALAAFAAAALHIVLARLWVPPAWLVTVPVRWALDQWWRKTPVVVKDEPLVHIDTESSIPTATNSWDVGQLYTESEGKPVKTTAKVRPEQASTEADEATMTASPDETTATEVIPQTASETTEAPVPGETLSVPEPKAEAEPVVSSAEAIPEPTMPETTEAPAEEAVAVPEPTAEPEPVIAETPDAVVTPVEAAEEPEPTTAIADMQEEAVAPVVGEEVIPIPTTLIDEGSAENLQEIVISIPTRRALAEEPTTVADTATSIPLPSDVVTETAPRAPVADETPTASLSQSYASYEEGGGGGASFSFRSSDLDGIELASDDPFNMSEPSGEAEETAAAESANGEDSHAAAIVTTEMAHNEAAASPIDAPEKEEL
jgi:hypothetical protein